MSDNKILEKLKKNNPFVSSASPMPWENTNPDLLQLNREASEYIEQESYRNAISKVYICRSYERDITPGDIIIFYRTGGYYKSVVTTIGIVEKVITRINSSDELINLCRKRSVFTDEELVQQWNYSYNKPFVVDFLYTYSFPHRINLQRLIELGIVADINSAPRGFTKISNQQLMTIIEETKSNENIIAN